MNHLGDITRINGAEVVPVWCITGGSPCQDLSIAGKRAGLAGARSGLYMEQIRIVKEMREHDRSIGRTGELVRPRYMVWENVPGAFSSNFKDGFGDFGAVLEEAVRIAEPGFSLPRLPDKQRWTKAGGMLGDGWSVAWRTHDAQYWGVPQRRRRISMVVDFNGHTAGDILFERFGGAESSGVHEVVTYPGRVSGSEVQPDAEGVRRDLRRAERRGKKLPEALKTVLLMQSASGGGCDGGGKGALVQTEKSGTLGTGNDQTIFCLQGNGIDRADTAGCNGKGWKEDISYTLNTIDRPAVMALDCYNQTARADAFPTLRHAATDYTHIPCTFSMQGFGDYKESEIVSSCKQRDSKDATDLVISIDDEKKRLHRPIRHVESSCERRDTTARYGAHGRSSAYPIGMYTASGVSERMGRHRRLDRRERPRTQGSGRAEVQSARKLHRTPVLALDVRENGGVSSGGRDAWQPV